MTIQYEKMIVLLFNQLFMFRLQTAKILYDLLQEAKRFLLFFFIGDYHIQSMRNDKDGTSRTVNGSRMVTSISPSVKEA